MATARDLRVLFLQGAAVRSGAERALLARLHELPENGVEPIVAFTEEGPFRDEVEAAGVETISVGPAPDLLSLGRIPAFTRALASAARTLEIGAIEGCGEKMSSLAGWAARSAGVGSVYNLQDAPWRSPRASLVQIVALSCRPDAVVVPSAWMAEAYRRRWGVHPRVVPNCLVLDSLPTQAVPVRPLADWPRDSVVVGLFARLVAWKGAEVFIRAAGRLRARLPGVRFLVVGGTLYGREPDLRSRLRALVAESHLSDRVHFTGHREDALGLMLDCDVLCHCALKPEPFGVSVIEGMALAKPMVASATGALPEILDDGRTGVLVEPGDDLELARVVEALARDGSRRREMGEAARAVARQEFSSSRIAGPLSEIYRRAAARE